MIRFILGGRRSGKSKFALQLGESLYPGAPHLFIATAISTDPEMEERILNHKKKRSPLWTLVEEPLHLGKLLKEHLTEEPKVYLVDCLGFWLNNLLWNFKLKDQEKEYQQEIKEFFSALKCFQKRPSEIIVVSNEVGLSIIPDSRISRIFSDELGKINQNVAELSDETYFLISGIPLKIKG